MNTDRLATACRGVSHTPHVPQCIPRASIISSDIYHATEPDVILAAITSQVPRRIRPTDYRLQEWKSAGLLFPSVVKSSLVTIDPALVRYRIGKVSHNDIAGVAQALKRALGL